MIIQSGISILYSSERSNGNVPFCDIITVDLLGDCE